DGLSITYAATPTLTGISASAKGVTVTWDAADGASGYRVFRRISGESAWTKLEDTEGTSYTDATAQAGVTYEYTVRCIASSGYTSGYDADGLSITAQ
ncbi:MAG: fibronectin type III domain-containing protein, partial [Clostridiales bacterium]|nr:fibronectin type III domain-containing protein [Clostridiales bacterium]